MLVKFHTGWSSRVNSRKSIHCAFRNSAEIVREGVAFAVIAVKLAHKVSQEFKQCKKFCLAFVTPLTEIDIMGLILVIVLEDCNVMHRIVRKGCESIVAYC